MLEKQVSDVFNVIFLVMYSITSFSNLDASHSVTTRFEFTIFPPPSNCSKLLGIFTD